MKSFREIKHFKVLKNNRCILLKLSLVQKDCITVQHKRSNILKIVILKMACETKSNSQSIMYILKP